MAWMDRFNKGQSGCWEVDNEVGFWRGRRQKWIFNVVRALLTANRGTYRRGQHSKSYDGCFLLLFMPVTRLSCSRVRLQSIVLFSSLCVPVSTSRRALLPNSRNCTCVSPWSRRETALVSNQGPPSFAQS
ncbi:hypothetical protein LZ31DRAFT_390160 [Colletotrichum somersetense]|nr:hypothetical protein LZ31DRAFT_390160 [Colletotrichum somersetense]